jgi:hypothetical protein
MPYDLSQYKLTLPVNADGGLEGKAAEIYDLADYESEWFQRGDGFYRFICPDGGAVTATARYPRCELRGLNEFGIEDYAEDKLKLRVNKIPDGRKTVVHQIHDRKGPWVKVVYWHRGGVGKLYALVKDRERGAEFIQRLDLLDGLSLGQSVVSYIRYDGARRELTVKGNSVLKRVPMFRDGSGGGAYFKRGNYFQSDERLGNRCVVEHLKV